MFTLKKLYIHKGCRYIKCLEEDKEYPLEHKLSHDFFANNIVVIALVGQNGAGKTSLIDIIFRIINNLGYCLYKKIERNASDPMSFVLGVKADLSYKIDDTDYMLKCRNRVMALEFGEKKIRFAVRNHSGHKLIPEESEFLDYEDYTGLTFEQMKEVAHEFFYTIATNYSMQAYIAQDYKDEPTLMYDKETNKNILGGDIWLNNLFHKNDGYLCPIVLNPYRDNGRLDMNNEEHLTTQRMEAILIEDDEQHPFMVNYDLDHIEYSFRPRTIQLGFRNPMGERMYLSEEEINEKNMRTILKENKYEYRQDEDLDDFYEAAHDSHSFPYAILKGLGLSPIGDMYTVQKAAKEYAVYKVLGIAEKYPSYSHYGDILSTECLFSSPTAERRNNELGLAEKLGRVAKENRSHIELKLKQILNFIEHTKNLSSEQWQSLEKTFNYKEYCEILNIPYKGMTLQERLEYLPPSIFKPTVYVRKKEDKAPIPLNQLSSGERQLYYQLSTLVYHMQNIKSIPDDGTRVKYNNVLLVLDELEICFHPDFQRLFINRIIETINSLGLNRVFRIHLLITTHSPFVLSDIPLPNILCLDDGKIKKMNIQGTFAANVYDLLNNPFFMQQYVGDFAIKKLDEIIKMVNADDHLSMEQYGELLNLVNLIGDEFIREKLKEELFDRLYTDDLRIAVENEINQHNARVQFLREELEKREKIRPRG